MKSIIRYKLVQHTQGKQTTYNFGGIDPPSTRMIGAARWAMTLDILKKLGFDWEHYVMENEWSTIEPARLKQGVEILGETIFYRVVYLDEHSNKCEMLVGDTLLPMNAGLQIPGIYERAIEWLENQGLFVPIISVEELNASGFSILQGANPYEEEHENEQT